MKNIRTKYLFLLFTMMVLLIPLDVKAEVTEANREENVENTNNTENTENTEENNIDVEENQDNTEDDNSKKDTEKRPNGVSMNKSKITLHTGEAFRLKIKGETKKIKWSVKDESVATVNEKGSVYGIHKGKTTVIAKVGKKTFQCNVTVKRNGFKHMNYNIKEGKKVQLKLVGVNEKVKWESKDEEIATVSKKGAVVGIKPGVVRIIGRTKERVYSCHVNVAAYKDVVYLTFDDGPSADVTPRILDVLKKKNVKATFFVLNYNAADERIIKRIVREGHTIALHGYSHVYYDIYRSENVFMGYLTKIRRKIKKTTGVDCTIMRFPGGSSNSVSRFNPGVMTRLTKKVLKEGYHYFDWNVSSNDSGKYKSRQSVYNNVTRGLKKNRDNIVLMHDFRGNRPTLDALEGIIDYAKKRGYAFKRITEDTKQVHQTVIN